MSDETSVAVNYKTFTFYYLLIGLTLFIFVTGVVALIKAEPTATKIAGIICMMLSFPVSFVISNKYVKNPFEKTIFDFRGIEQGGVFFQWEEIKKLEKKYEKGNVWHWGYFILLITSNEKDPMRIELMDGEPGRGPKGLISVFKKFCPRQDLIQMVDIIFGYTKNKPKKVNK